MCSHTGGNGSWLELTAVAAVSAHLYARNGSAVQVLEPIHVSIPLPSDSPVKVDTSIPVWQFEAATGKQCPLCMTGSHWKMC